MAVLPLEPGDPPRLGSYRLTGRLGEGGQGVVYRGEGPSGEPVAIKVLKADADPKARQRLARELAAARSVAPFCTARVIESRVDGARPHVVSEYVDGPSLHERVTRQGPLSGGDLDRLIVATVTALTAIHGAGIVHRDLKPANVLLGPDGPRVVDFGIARAIDAETHTQLVGTPAYFAPEWLRGEPPTPASDVFAWAGTMVFAATGRPPFGKTESIPAVMHRIATAAPDLTGVPTRLVALLTECLNKSPALRPTARALLVRLVDPSAGFGGAGDAAPGLGGDTAPGLGGDTAPGLGGDAVPGLGGDAAPGLANTVQQALANTVQQALANTPGWGPPRPGGPESIAMTPPPAAQKVPAHAVPSPGPAPAPTTVPAPRRNGRGLVLAAVGGGVTVALLAVAGWLYVGRDGSANPSPPRAASTSPSEPATTVTSPADGTPTIPSVFAGTWTGNVTQLPGPLDSDGSSSAVTMTLPAGKPSAAAHYTDWGCREALEVTGASAGTLKIDETTVSGPPSCMGGSLTLTRSGDRLRYESTGLAFRTTGTLRKT